MPPPLQAGFLQPFTAAPPPHLCRDPENRKRGRIPPALMCTCFIAHKPHCEPYLPICTDIPTFMPSCKPKCPVQEVQMSYFTQRETEAGKVNPCASRTFCTTSTQLHRQCHGDFSFWKPTPLCYPSPHIQSNPAMVSSPLTCGISALPSL